MKDGSFYPTQESYTINTEAGEAGRIMVGNGCALPDISAQSTALT